MRIELLHDAPIRAALEEITEKEGAQSDATARAAWGEARAILDAAIARAANPELKDGVDPETFGKLLNPPITAQGVRKRAHRQGWFENGAAVKRGGKLIIFPDKVSQAS